MENANLQKLFSNINKKKTGLIDKEELKDFILTVHPDISKKELNKIIDETPKEGLAFNEFSSIWTSHIKTDPNINVIEEVFNIFDVDRNGLIDKSELKSVLDRMGVIKTDREVDRMFDVADKDKDGGISLEDFKDLFRNYKFG